MRWSLSTDQQPTSLAQLQQLLLSNRGITTKTATTTFFSPVHPTQLSAKDLGIDKMQLEKALDRIHLARQKQQKILIFGDYDADGISATAVLWQTLHAAGCKVMPFIPDRRKHGYGLSQAGLDDIFAQGKPDLIITVDNGIVAFDALAYAQKAGVEVIVTDHHSPEHGADGTVQLPAAIAVVHTTQLCGTTVSWMVSYAVANSMPDTSEADQTTKAKTLDTVVAAVDLCAIATIADQVPLTNANRAFAYHGVFALRQTRRPGILALLELSSSKQEVLDTYTINYVLAPRINAMGRLAHGLEALRLLCTNSKEKARELAVTLNQTNADRQELTSDLVELALAQAKDRIAASTTELKVIVVASDQFHEGVVGLVAGKLVEVFTRPAIAISLHETVGKASARSVPGVNIIELIRQVKDDLLEAGGHPMAAGFGLKIEKVEIVRQRLEQIALDQIGANQLEAVAEVECTLPYSLVSKKSAQLLTKFSPFGKGNPEPVFLLQNCYVRDVQTMGKEGRHLRFKVVPADDLSAQPVGCVGWGLATQLEVLQQAESSNRPIELLVKLGINNWKDREYLQLVVEDVRVQP